MHRIAHIVNPVAAGPDSDLHEVQPLVFASMKTAKEYACECADVHLYTTQYPEDHVVIPDFFQKTPDLELSVLDVGSFPVPRKLPLIKDILDRLYEASDAEYFIYTNVDIILQPFFYTAVGLLISKGYDAFTINKRVVRKQVAGLQDLPLVQAEVGEPHPGFDCFVFRRDVYPHYLLGSICIGAPLVGAGLAINLAAHAQRFYAFTDLHLTCHLRNDECWWAPEYHAYGIHNFEEYQKIYAHYDTIVQEFEDAAFAKRLRGAAAHRPFSEESPSLSRRCIDRGASLLPPFVRKRTLPRFLRRIFGRN